MHAGRRVPYRLTLLLLLAACGSPRYVGSIGRDGTYSNRGYGLAIRLEADGLGERWEAIDPSAADRAPRGVRPKVDNSPLDIDGDGILTLTERQQHYVPTLRLLSRTSSVARIDVDVMILGGKNRKVPIDAVMALDLKARAGTSSAAVDRAIEGMQRTKIASSFDARVAELVTPRRFTRVAVIDQGDLLAEQSLKRRQIVKVVLTAARRTDALVADHDRLLDAVILNRRSSSETVREQW